MDNNEDKKTDQTPPIPTPKRDSSDDLKEEIEKSIEQKLDSQPQETLGTTPHPSSSNNQPSVNIDEPDPEEKQTDSVHKSKATMIIAIITVILIAGAIFFFMMSSSSAIPEEQPTPLPTAAPTQTMETSPTPSTIEEEIDSIDVEDQTPTDFQEIQTDIDSL